MDAAEVKQAIEAAKADYKKAMLKGSVYEMGVVDGLDLALKAVAQCVVREQQGGA